MELLAQLGGAAARLGVGSLAALAAIHKLRDLARARRATQTLTGASGAAANIALGAAIAVEAGSGAMCLTGFAGKLGPVLLAALWLTYAAALARRQRADDCGCGFGSRSPSHAFSIVRNLSLAALALAAGVFAPSAGALAMGAAAAPAALAFILLYLAADELGSHPRLTWSRS
ncbi:MauE/DoxX family redox-associated membrane protein [Caulobacter sp. KR2-114]|uniref:MauE/DoxX family redox-associated membrane protein n=1 Tax=Caulobacter sp. KR2-114 TaxID=3400912 RepID=UPI003C0D5D6F